MADAAAIAPLAHVAPSLTAAAWQPDDSAQNTPSSAGAPPASPWKVSDADTLAASDQSNSASPSPTPAEAESEAQVGMPQSVTAYAATPGTVTESGLIRTAGSMIDFPFLSADGRDYVGVDLSSGNLFVNSTDVSMQAPGVGIEFNRVYNSMANTVGDVSDNWSSNFGLLGLEISDSQVRYQDQTGRIHVFTKQGDKWTPQPGDDLTYVVDSLLESHVEYNRTGQRVVFSEYGWPLRIEDRNHIGVQISYNSDGTFKSLIDGSGRVLTLNSTVVNGHRTITGTSAGGRTTTYTTAGGVGARAQLTQAVTVAAGQSASTSYEYNQNGKLYRIIRGDRSLAIEYDTAPGAVGRVTGVRASMAGQPDLVWSFGGTLESQPGTYRLVFTTTNVRMPDGTSMTYKLDTDGYVTGVTDPLGRTRTTTYSGENHNATAQTGADANTTNFKFDSFNNVTSQTLPTGAASQAFYAAGVDCPNAQAGLPYSVKCRKTADGVRNEYSYDSVGNMTKRTTSKGSENSSKTFEYENAQHSLCGTITGLLCTSIDENGNRTSYSYSRGQVTRVTPPSPLGATNIAYDGLGRVSKVTDGNGAVTTYQYDLLDQVVQVDSANAGSMVYSYDANGAITSVQDTLSNVRKDYARNTRQQVISETVSTSRSGLLTGTTTMSYDANGRMTSLNDGTGTTQYAYDAAGQMTSVQMSGGNCASNPHAAGSNCITFEYDKAGRETKRYFPGNAVSTRSYDASGRLTRLNATNTAGTLVLDVEWFYRDIAGVDRGNIQKRAAHVHPQVARDTTSWYAYGLGNRLVSENIAIPGQPAQYRSYGYDPAGNRTSQSGDAGPASLSFNAANEITASAGQKTAWQYDAVGNELKNGHTGSTRTYNSRLSLTGSDGKAVESFGPGNNDMLAYGDMRFLNTSLGMLKAQEPGQPLRTFTPGTNGQTLATSMGDASRTRYYVYDGLGSNVLEFDQTGNVRNAALYYAYGNMAKPVASNLLGVKPTFAGGVNIDGTTKFGARFYDSTTGRFTQYDPSGQEAHPYAYARCNPVNVADSTGLVSEYCDEAAAFVVGAPFVVWGWALGATAGAILSPAGLLVGMFLPGMMCEASADIEEGYQDE